ncbi:hypothetical protein AB1N83_010330, partial [Pleurotus pulmonarius]
PCYF